jgi:ATP-dependent 26S proteasome regulatory subunit
LRLAPIAPARREDIVLPEKTLALVERNTLGFAREAERLARLGLSAKKGVLLHGPPGTGKTLLVRWLAGALPGYTKLLVTAGQYALLDEYLAIARALQPALVVLEDIDLVGGHRDGPARGPGALLARLLNEMDGLAAEARVLFVLTTNRPEVLEPALAARPGRIDQAIEIGLPDEPERERLVRRYAGAAQVAPAVAAATAKRIGRVSPAFIKELMRRSAQAMLERGGTAAIESVDVEHAAADMLGVGGRLGARILGAEGAIGFAARL